MASHRFWQIVIHSDKTERQYSVGIIPAPSAALAVEEAFEQEKYGYNSRAPKSAYEARPWTPWASRALSLPVRRGLILNIGTLHKGKIEDESVRFIEPPEQPVFDQLAMHLLAAKPPPAAWAPGRDAHGRAGCALTLRWSSYYAALCDLRKPLWSKAGHEDVSHISDAEMARLNIEISANIERLYNLFTNEPDQYRHLVYHARNLPDLPRPRGARRPVGLLSFVEGDMVGAMRDFNDRAVFKAFTENEIAKVVATKPEPRHVARVRRRLPRRFANHLTLSLWRNSVVEDLHAGRGLRLPLTVRRIPPDAHREILHNLTSGSAGNVQLFRALGQATTSAQAERLWWLIHGPRWSLTEQTRGVVLWG